MPHKVQTTNRNYTDASRAADHKFYVSTAWLKVRDFVLYRDSWWCQLCHNAIADTVDHVLERSIFPHLSLDVNNCRAVCRACHNKRHAPKKK